MGKNMRVTFPESIYNEVERIRTGLNNEIIQNGSNERKWSFSELILWAVMEAFEIDDERNAILPIMWDLYDNDPENTWHTPEELFKLAKEINLDFTSKYDLGIYLNQKCNILPETKNINGRHGVFYNVKEALIHREENDLKPITHYDGEQDASK